MLIKTRDGTRLFVKSWGTGRPVVLTHGWSLSADWWDEIAVALVQASYRIITYDRRGFGRSDQPGHGYDYDGFADDLADVLAATGADADVALVGYSMGSGEVARYMSRHGGRGVSRAALISPVVPLLLKASDNPDGFDPDKFDKMTADMTSDRPSFFHTYAKNLYGGSLVSHPVGQPRIDWTFNMTLQAGLWPLLAAREAFGRTDFRPDLPAFTVPTLIVHGTDDSDAPIAATGRAAGGAIASSRLIEYSGATHGLPITHGERLVGDLKAFLAQG